MIVYFFTFFFFTIRQTLAKNLMFDVIFNQSCIFGGYNDFFEGGMWCDGGSREKILFSILNCVSQEMLFPSSTFKCFTKKIIIIKQTSHSLLSGTYSVYSCYLYVCAMCTKVPVFSYCMLFCANIFTLLLISKMKVNAIW